jgi:hypothetical protein
VQSYIETRSRYFPRFIDFLKVLQSEERRKLVKNSGKPCRLKPWRVSERY